MIRFVTRRMAQFVPVLFAIVTLTFFLIRMAPGGPFDSERAVSREALRQIEKVYNLDAPLHVQYVDYMKDLFRGDLGPSLRKPERSVSEWIVLRVPVSLELGAYALVIALAIGLTAGCVAALRPNSLTDYAPMSFAMMGICIPNFVLGPVLVLVFALWMEWLPVSGWNFPSDKVL
ncbi:MAG: ABC transporter, partial [bacterium]|nr:ABC transporter [bacterium]